MKLNEIYKSLGHYVTRPLDYIGSTIIRDVVESIFFEDEYGNVYIWEVILSENLGKFPNPIQVDYLNRFHKDVKNNKSPASYKHKLLLKFYCRPDAFLYIKSKSCMQILIKDVEFKGFI